MKNSLARSFPRLSLPLVALVLAMFAACGHQSEGARCVVSTDCSDGLVCTKSSLLQGTAQNLCCPSDLSKASTASCKGAANTQPDLEDLVDASPAAHDARADAPADAVSDAGLVADSAGMDASGGQ